MRLLQKKTQEPRRSVSQVQERSYTFLIVPGVESRVRKIVVRERLLKRVATAAGIAALVFGLFLIDYARSLSRGQELKRLRAETAEQRVKAAQVTRDLAELENEMSRLRKLEGRLRTAFDLDPGLFLQDSSTGDGGGKADQGSHTGIGGSDEVGPKSRTGVRGGEPSPESKTGVRGGETSRVDTSGSLAERRRVLAAQVDLDLERMKDRIKTQEQGFSQLVSFLEERKSQLASVPSITPVRGWVSSGFQRRIDPFTGNEVWHRGLDISTDMGTPVLAPADGTVNFIGHQADLGTMMSLDHGYGYLTRYGHNSKIIVQTGQKVRRGQVIALVGNTGKSTGPHLHYEVFHNGVPVNPQDYIIN